MTYTPATFLKAFSAFAIGLVGAASAAAGGPDLSHLDIGSWLSSAAVGLTGAAAAFSTPVKKADANKSVAEVATEAIHAAAANKVQAESDLAQIAKAAEQVLGTVPVLGSLAQAAIAVSRN